MSKSTLLKATAISLLSIYSQSLATEAAPHVSAEIRYDHHRFTPNKIEVPPGIPLQLTVVNSSSERMEFESFKLNREKVIEPGQTIVLRLPALREGRYDFFDDFHGDVPEGVIVVR